MTNLTPEQMRALADVEVWDSSDLIKIDAALRSAADRLDAVQTLVQQCSNWRPGDGSLDWSITDHYFVDTEFWQRLFDILAPHEPQQETPSPTTTQPQRSPQTGRPA